MRFRHYRFHLTGIVGLLEKILGIVIRMINFVRRIGSLPDIVESHIIRFDDAIFPACFNRHVAQGHALFHGKLHDRVTPPFHRPVGRAIHPDIANNTEDHILGHDMLGKRTGKLKTHRLGDLDPKLAGTQNKCRVRITDAGGKHAEGTRCAGMGIRAKQNVTGSVESFLGQSEVANPFVIIGPDIKIMRQRLLLHKLAKDVYISISVGILGKDKMIGNDHYLVPVPYFCVFAKLLFKDREGTRSANIMRHQHIRIHPDIVARLDRLFTCMRG